jgi:hypothetical protein
MCFTTKAEDPEILAKLPVISGYVRDFSTGEMLIGATIYLKDSHTGTASNLYGFYSLATQPGNKTVVYGFLGYQTREIETSVTTDIQMNVELTPNSAELSEVRVVANQTSTRLDDPMMGVQRIQASTIKEVPAFMGEVDPIKVIQLLPGVQAASEGSSGFSVRGGNPDQNLVLLDEAIVYNAGHLLGFFSIFNNDAIKDVNLYKGDIPARSGGRLSSLLDVRMKDGNSRKLSGTGGIGTISSRLTLEGPIVKDKTTFLASGRRTYADLFLPLSKEEALKDSKLFFYDFNAKINHTFSDQDRIFLSGYFGRDVMDNTFSRIDFGNSTFTFRWNHVYSPKLFSNISLFYSNYNYMLGTSEGVDGFDWRANMENFSFKADFNYYHNNNHSVSFGVQSIHHNIMPGHVKGIGSSTMFNELKLSRNKALEHAAYIENTQNIGEKLTVRYGLRASLFQNIGKSRIHGYDENFDVVDTTYYKKGEVFNNYWGIEPRAGINYMIGRTASIKASFSRTFQYLHMASNSTGTTPFDVWFPSTPNVKPQISDQVSAGFLKHLFNGAIETGVEVFYKNMQNSIDFKDYADILLNEHLEGEFRFGKGYAYGLEFLTYFNYGKLNGWVGYTWSKSKRKIKEINDGQWYLSPYDHPHDCSVVVTYRMSQRITLSGNWVYFSGSPATFPVGRFESGGDIVPIYSRRNAERLPDYQRMDLSLTLRGRTKPGRSWNSEWVFSAYNAYGSKNAWVINFQQDKDDPYITKATKTYLFSIIPAVTYNFKF